MKTSCIFAVFALSVFVEGAFWAAAVQPIILSIGAAFAALNIDAQPFLDVDWKNLLILKNDKDETTTTKEQSVSESEKEKEKLDKLHEQAFQAKYIDPKKQELD